MNIGIDIDDTISDTYETMFPYAQKYTIEELQKNGKVDNKYNATHLYIETMHNWNEEEAEAFWNKYFKIMLPQIRVRKFAVETIKKLAENNKIILITARWEDEKGTIQKITEKWLEDNDIVYDKLIVNAQDKLKIAKENNIDLFIDDSFKNCQEVSSGGIKALIMDSRNNTTYNDEKITRVYSWPHVYQEYENIVKGEA